MALRPGLKLFTRLAKTLSHRRMASSSVCLQDFDVVGFDIDHTLAKYNLPNLFDLVHNSFAKYLVEKKGYHKDLLEPFHKHRDFCARGLVFDIKHGNLLKVGQDGTILRASHGTRFLSVEEINKVYTNQHWSRTDELIKNVDNIGDGECMIFENFYDMIGVVVIARLIDIIDREAGNSKPDYSSYYSDVKDAYTETYIYKAFAEKSGGFFPQIQNNPSKYIEKCAEDVKRWLKHLRGEGKLLFFMTSSYVDFATMTLDFILSDDWKNYFDVGLSRARKPSFFFANRPFLQLEENAEKEAVESLQRGNVYSQGNIDILHKFLSVETGKDNPKVVYFGDSIRSDIFPSSFYTDWTTVTILEEIDAEVDLSRHSANGQPEIKRKKIQEVDKLTSEYISSSGWGSFFIDSVMTADSSKMKTVSTLWDYILRKYSTFAIPTLSHITELPLDHKFSVFDSENMGTSGFYPCPPKVLHNKL